MARITADEWMVELERAMRSGNGDGMTTREIAHAVGLGADATDRRLRALFEEGRLGCGRRRILSRDGVERLQPVYWIREPKREVKKAARGPRKGRR